MYVKIYFSNSFPNDEDEWSFRVVYKSFTSKSLFRPVLKSFKVHLKKKTTRIS